ncbi:tagatose 6-phosphate kinase [Streptomyces sp. 2224.1]|uniref:1-phosphofructokinase family hexose kinase n=1 Tax=unclassified Streptomyces TaxID=2593676 RepID=UPI0008801EAC|nr:MULTISPECIES: 1-phosphofructokinase family hexose kinase [unclassified Streptomyces]PBC84339.1 tagatose 6-phosphate kinase [Streptomyces sp. 2321.6]SDR32126.1 tagatose 6-phosphate kinase [Streptomyces sp. KS_16]SEB74826.1 tagatose 6-phosphate kinase [Streptomyces sp. 2224.1]SED27923.1 tagatose 6-phosphate kinase [Streptomyces sp. 2133.1]SEE55719.1 tagatose 6-phosphate kinase [Streptomyces sp. 2112.3]
MILTVTLNAALDITYRVPRLQPHATNRITEVSERPGGKGLNVARVLAALGHRTVATGFAGGGTGEALRALLAETDVTDALVPVGGATRRTVAVADASSGDTTQLNEPGPIVTPAEWDTFLGTYRELLGEARAVALCGSLPPGVPVDVYARLTRAARSAGVPVLLDTSGEPLRRGLAARPDLAKPNADELAALTGSTEPLRAARDARRRGAHAVAASLGPDGMLAVTADGAWQAAPPQRIAGNPTGAGDSAVAGLLSGLVEELPWPDRLARAVALSAATVRAPAAGEFDAATYEELLARVVVTSAHPPSGPAR